MQHQVCKLHWKDNYKMVSGSVNNHHPKLGHWSLMYIKNP
jgi:hypothetical protein